MTFQEWFKTDEKMGKLSFQDNQPNSKCKNKITKGVKTMAPKNIYIFNSKGDN